MTCLTAPMEKGTSVGIHPPKIWDDETISGMFHSALDVLALGCDTIRSHHACVWVMLAGARQTCTGWELQDPCPGHSGIIPVIRSYHKLDSPRAGICSIDGECICQLILSAKCVDFSEVRCENFYICGSLNQQESDS